MACKPNKTAFKQVCAELEAGNELTFTHIGAIFGEDFWAMIVMAFMDAQDAARAIQGAIARITQIHQAPQGPGNFLAPDEDEKD